MPGAQPNPPVPTVSPAASAIPSASPAAASPAQRKPAAPGTISANEIAGYETYSPDVRKLLDLALGLTTQKLGYKYGSADPAKGGMDCSGFIYYVLSKIGVNDPPRDAREQYTWVRKTGAFQAVLAHRDDSFELDGLMPGDLLFWSGTYFVDPDPAITHTMIYLGREKGTNRRLMIGASDGRIYKGQSRLGVSVFEFKISPPKGKADDRPSPVFVGYGKIPTLPRE